MTTKSKEVNPAVWRRGQDWIYGDKEYIVSRTGAGQYLSWGIVEEAFQTGFTMKTRAIDEDRLNIDEEDSDKSIDENNDEIIDNNRLNTDENNDDDRLNNDEPDQKKREKAVDEEHPANDAIINDDKYRSVLYAVKQAIGHKRTYEWSALMKLKKFKGKEDILVWGDSSNTTLKYEDDGDTVHEVIFAPFKKDVTEPDQTQYTFSASGKDILPLEDVIILRNKDINFGDSKADIDPYLDSLFTLATIFEMIGLWSIRSIGVPIFMGDESLWDKENESLKAEVMTELKHWGVNSKFMVPKTIRGTETKIELFTPADNPNFGSAIEGILAEISIGTGIPREKLLGNPVGLRSSDINQSNFWIALEKIHMSHVQHFEWAYRKMWPELIKEDDDFYLEINPFKILDAFKQMELKNIQLDALAKAQALMDQFGLSPQVILDWLSIDITVDDTIISEFQNRREILINRGADQNSDDERTDRGEDKDSPSKDDDQDD